MADDCAVAAPFSSIQPWLRLQPNQSPGIRVGKGHLSDCSFSRPSYCPFVASLYVNFLHGFGQESPEQLSKGGLPELTNPSDFPDV
jgi:hypothetical protein